MKIITLANEKGGVGKSTLAVHLAAGLAINGRCTVLIDADAQASATSSLGFSEQPGLYDLLVRDASFNDKLIKVSEDVYKGDISGNFTGSENDEGEVKKPAGSLYLMPSNVETRNIAHMLPDITTVLDRFSDLEGWADVVIFDTPPTPSLFHSAIYVATDYVIHPCVCESLSIEGLEKSMSRLKPIGAIREAHGKPPAKTLGIIPTMFRASTALHSYNLAQLKEKYGGLVKTEIPQRIAWSEAAQLHMTVFAYNAKDSATHDARTFVKEVMESMGHAQS